MEDEIQEIREKWQLCIISVGQAGLKGFVTGVKNYGLDIVENTKAFGNNMMEYGKGVFYNISGNFTSSKVTSVTDDVAEATLKTVTKEGTQSLAKEVMESAIKSGPLDALTTIGFNAYDYGLGENKDKGIISQEFAVSVGVDLIQSVVAGLAAALIAVLVIAGVSLAFPAVVVAAPVVLVGTAILAAGIDIVLSLTVNDKIKKYINALLDS